jgi:hypothetical protein
VLSYCVVVKDLIHSACVVHLSCVLYPGTVNNIFLTFHAGGLTSFYLRVTGLLLFVDENFSTGLKLLMMLNLK